ncbi:unnamed protein product [Colias eurytheme]|nr:unnamed protein product [Colias eurytheme]
MVDDLEIDTSIVDYSDLCDLNPVFAQSQRGNPVIMIGQFRFNRVNKYGSRTRWVCVKAKAGCRASLHTMDNAIVRVWGFHDPVAHISANRF